MPTKLFAPTSASSATSTHLQRTISQLQLSGWFAHTLKIWRKITLLSLLCSLVCEISEGQQVLDPEEPEVKIGNELCLFILLTKLNMDQTFPNVYIMFCIYLCMMITNCEGDRSFLKLARIKNQL